MSVHCTADTVVAIYG